MNDPNILKNIYLAHQLDQLHVSLTTLFDLLEAGEIDLIIDQEKKSPAQRASYLKKVIESLSCLELRELLSQQLEAENFSFFLSKNLLPFIQLLQKEAEKIQIVKLTLAFNFPEKDLKEMAQVLNRRIQEPVVLDIAIERNLIGGVIIQYGNYITDYSIRASLNQFREHWHQAVVVKK